MSLLRPLALALLLLAPAVANAESEVLSSGTFTGASDHITTGNTSIIETPAGRLVVFAEDFSLDGAPDPKVGFGKDGEFDSATTLAPLQSLTGAQVYTVPDSVDVGAYNEVYVWCERFSVPLGVAQLD